MDSAEAIPVLGAALLGVALSAPGQMSVNGIWTAAVAQYLDAQYTSVAFAFTIGALLGGVVIFFIGRPIDKLGPRWSTFLFTPFFCGAVALVGWVEQPWQYGCCAFLFRGLAKGVDIAAKTALAQWFKRYRGRAVGLVNTIGIGGVVMCGAPLFVTHAVATQGLRAATGIVAASTVVGLLIAATGYRPNNLRVQRPWVTTKRVGDVVVQTTHSTLDAALADLRTSTTCGMVEGPGPETEGLTVGDEDELLALKRAAAPSERDVLQSQEFWFLMLPGAVHATAGTSFFFFLPAIGASLSLENYEVLYPAYAIGSVLSNLIGGFIVDKLPAPTLVRGVLLLVSTNMLMLAFNFGGALPGLTLGMQDGMTQVLSASQLPTYFGTGKAGFAQAANMAIQLLISGLCPFAVGILYERGLLRAMWVTLAACGIAAAVLALRMRPPMTLAPQKSKQKTNVSDKVSDEERTESTIEP
jgi:MFS family permease